MSHVTRILPSELPEYEAAVRPAGSGARSPG